MESIFDLPAHPLMVHFPVVAIPLLALIAILLVARPSMRSSWRWFAIALGVVTAVATVLAASSGEALVEVLDNEEFVETHESLGETLRIFVIGLAASLSALLLLARDEASARRRLGAGLGAITILFALLSIVWTIRTGHEGAKLTWGGVDLSVETEDDDVDDEESEDDEGEDDEDEDEDALAAVSSTETTTAVQTTSTTTSTTEAPTTSATPGSLDGMALFEANCSRCHGSNGAGTRGPSLLGIAAAHPEVQTEINQIINGGDRMPSFGDKLSEPEILAIVGYYRSAFIDGDHSHDG